MAKGDDFQERLIEFSAGIVKVCEGLPKTTSGRHIARQLLRCGTAPAAHNAEARGAESRNDFIHKLKLCSKELNETLVWLKIITRSNLMNPSNSIKL
jgi:four helix bundle protein